MAFEQTIRVLVMHADPVARAGLAAAFSRYADLVVEEARVGCDDHASLLQVPPSRRADVIVTSEMVGIPLARTFKEQTASAKIVIVGGIDREWAVRDALGAGVRGYLLAGTDFDELADCVRAVHRGARHLSPRAAMRLAESVAVDALTEREEQVLVQVVEGLCNKAIAKRLDISVGTVKSHLKSTFEKLQVSSRTQAMAVVERRGLLRGRQREMSIDAPRRELH